MGDGGKRPKKSKSSKKSRVFFASGRVRHWTDGPGDLSRGDQATNGATQVRGACCEADCGLASAGLVVCGARNLNQSQQCGESGEVVAESGL